MSFENKVVIITGSGSGIGAATAVLFAKEKANIAIVDINEAGAEATKARCEISNNKVIVIKADVSKDDDARCVIEKTIEDFGRIDILVNNAGIVREEKILDGTMMKTYDQVVNTNLRAVVMMTNIVAPYLVKVKGCIVNMSSVVAISPRLATLYPSYVISKAGVRAFTEHSAIELGPHGVRVNAVCPGPVETPMLMNCNATEDMAADITVLNRFLDPKEISDMIIYLASDKARGVTGSAFVVDAGMLIK